MESLETLKSKSFLTVNILITVPYTNLANMVNGSKYAMPTPTLLKHNFARRED